jgi:hypothetical protein
MLKPSHRAAPVGTAGHGLGHLLLLLLLMLLLLRLAVVVVVVAGVVGLLVVEQ